MNLEFRRDAEAKDKSEIHSLTDAVSNDEVDEITLR